MPWQSIFTNRQEGQPSFFYPKVLITTAAFELLVVLIERFAPYEVSGLGEVELVDNSLVISKIHYFGGHHGLVQTDITKELGDWLYELVKTDGDPSKIHLWWHSHGQAPAFWSQTDLETIEGQIAADYLISLVGNVDQDFRCRLDIYQPFRVVIDNLAFPRLLIEPTSPARQQAEALFDRYHRRFTELQTQGTTLTIGQESDDR